MKVLLVEDNPGDARLIREILREAFPDQLDLTSVERLAEAMVGLADDTIDVILLDLSLPDASGLETIIKMHKAALNLPIVILTGHEDEQLALQALREGAQDYLHKHNLDSHLLKRVLRYAVERKRTSQAQRESEERFRVLVQYSTNIITILAADGTVLYESPSLEVVMGYKPEAVQGLNMANFIHPDDLPSLLDAIQTILDQPTMKFTCEGRMRHADGSWRMLEMTMSNLLDQPAVHGIVVNSCDVTERRQIEEQLMSQAKVLDQVSDSIVKLDLNGTIESWNYGSERLYGWSADEVIGKSIVEIIQTQVVNDTMDNAVRTVLETGRWDGEYQQTNRDGVIVPVLNATTLLRDEHGNAVGYIGINRDITERKHTERSQQQYNRRLEVLHSIDHGILTAQSSQQIAELVAQSFASLIQCDALRIIAIDSHDNLLLPYLADHPVASQTSQDLLQQTVKNYGVPESFRRGEVLLIDDIQTHKNLWVGYEDVLTAHGLHSWIIIPLIAGEQLVGILASGSFRALAFSAEHVEIAREIADQMAVALHKNLLHEQIQEHARQLEARISERTEQLHSAKERSDAILMSASDAMLVVHLDGSIDQVNTAFTALFGYTHEQIRKVSLFSLFDSNCAHTVRRALDEIASSDTAKRVEVISMRQDMTYFDADAAFSNVEDGKPTTLICSIRDITERKRIEAELRQAWAKEKELNELKTRFVSMVSHDFRTPLASIQSSSDLLENYSDRMTDEKKTHHFTTINRQIQHLTGLLKDMLTITKAESVSLPFHPTLIDLGIFCQTIADEMQQLDGTRQIRLIIKQAGEPVNVDGDLLRRAIVNLLSNAMKYSSNEGVTNLSLFVGNEHIEITVQDQGIGIPEDDKNHLFEVFHRAKNVGNVSGTGLGLAIVKRVVDAHGGEIRVQSEVGVGSTFTISLPLNRLEEESKCPAS